jgi:hypothetical protein
VNHWGGSCVFQGSDTVFWRNILLPSSGSYSFLRLHGVVIQKTTVRIFMKFSNVMRYSAGPRGRAV